MNAPVRVRQLLPRVVRFDPKEIRKAVSEVEGFNAKVALVITRSVGTMACAYLFALIALISLPDAIKAGRPAIISWIAQTFLQLVLLSIIMVGQSVQSAASDARAAKEFADTEIILELKEAGQRIVEVPIPTYYGDEICYVDGLGYAADVTKDVITYRLQKAGFGDGNRIAGIQPRHADAMGAAEIEIDAVDAGAEFLDEAETTRLGQHFLRHRRRHDEDNVGIANQRRARGERILIDEAQRPVRRNGGLNRRPDLRMKRIEDGNGHAGHLAIHGTCRGSKKPGRGNDSIVMDDVDKAIVFVAPRDWKPAPILPWW